MNIPYWQEWLDELRGTFSEKVYVQYFARLKPVSYVSGRMMVQVPMGVDLGALSPYKILAQMAYLEVAHQQVELEFVAEKAPEADKPKFTQMPRTSLNDKYVFEKFVMGKNSEFAFHAARSVANQPGMTRYNPLLIYGKPGLGKTHLMQAIGHYIRQTDPTKVVCYISADDFAREYMEVIKNANRDSSGPDAFANYYRKEVDILLIDDIQHFSGKEGTQVEFFHIFNALHQSGKQLVFTSDVEPSLVKGLEERLISRFQWGLCVDIQAPDVETREAILRRKAEEEHLDLPDDVVSFVARTLESNVRDLEMMITRLLAQASIFNEDITLEMTRGVLHALGKAARPKANLEEIVERVAEYYQVDGERLLDSGRGTKEVALARQIAMFFLKELSSLSLKSIGARFSGRDHSTVVHAIKTVQKLIEGDAQFKRELESLRSRLN